MKDRSLLYSAVVVGSAAAIPVWVAIDELRKISVWYAYLLVAVVMVIGTWLLFDWALRKGRRD